MRTFFEFTDLEPEAPKISDYHQPLLRVGQSIILDATIEREWKGRHEKLHIKGPYTVEAVRLERTPTALVQIASVSSSTIPPHWVAKKSNKKPLVPSKWPRTCVKEDPCGN